MLNVLLTLYYRWYALTTSYYLSVKKWESLCCKNAWESLCTNAKVSGFEVFQFFGSFLESLGVSKKNPYDYQFRNTHLWLVYHITIYASTISYIWTKLYTITYCRWLLVKRIIYLTVCQMEMTRKKNKVHGRFKKSFKLNAL